MQILVIGRTFPNEKTGSVGLFEYQQAQALNKSNNSVIYGFIDNQSIKVHTQVKKVSRVENTLPIYGYYLPIGGLQHDIYDMIKFKLFKRLLNKVISIHGDIDIIHFHFPILTLNNEIINYLLEKKIKFVVTEHWTKVQDKKISKRQERILKSIFESAENIIAVSNVLSDSLDYYKSKFKISIAPPIVVIPNLINSNFFNPKKIEDCNFNFITIGRLTPIKGNDKVIDAFSQISKEYLSMKLIIVGEGKEKINLEKQAKKLDLEDRIEFCGYLSPEEISRKLAKADCYVTGSSIETFGVPMIEAWFSGIPVIVGSNHPLRDLINVKNGAVYDYNENNNLLIDSLAAKMKTVFHNEYDRNAIANESYDSFSSDRVVERILRLYDNISR